MEIIEWIINQKEWVFSGIGVLIISLMISLSIWVFERRKKKSVEIKNEIIGDDNIQIKGKNTVGSINVTINNPENQTTTSKSNLIKIQDIELYLEIRNTIDETMKLIKEFDFGASYRIGTFDKFYEIERKFEYPEFEFLDEEFEKIKKELCELILNFTSYICVNCFPNGGNFIGIPPEWCHEQPERYENTRNELNRLGSALWETYSLFIKKGRKKFES